ncbi:MULTISPECIES: hypothetical protein [Rhodomicrobium]|uniref:hypothetical protein n=1 Tax=Rhodomicrobium TaxID=1068 RepID=UPI000F7438C3|nr:MULTISPECIES: hypothetical protein [Rhodomicrobium]
MKRCLCLLLIVSGLLFAGSPAAFAFPLIGKAYSPLAEQSLADKADDDRGRKLLRSERKLDEEKKERKSLGAGFWGGPYWGYGPRWGHPCESCRASCEGDEDGNRCRRCRMRCGW